MSESWELVGRATTFSALAKDLAALPGVHVVDRHLVQRVLLDTFDWRVHRAGIVLEAERTASAESLVARSLEGDELARQVVERTPVLAADLPAGRVRDLVASALEMRALLEQVRIDSTRERFVLRNEDEKIVARVTLERLRVGSFELDPRVVVEPVRGYTHEARALMAVISARMPVDALEPAKGVEALFAAGDSVPRSYSGKFKVKLKPDAAPAASMAKLLLDLLDTMEQNENGVVDDIDSEFLHDFRVAIRRTRSLLPVARRTFRDTATIDAFIAEFRSFVQPTGDVRDLDVFLLGFDHLADGVAPEWRGDLAKLEPLIVKERTRARRRLLTALRRTWPDLRVRWRSYLEAEAAGVAGARGGGVGAPSSGGSSTDAGHRGDDDRTDVFARHAVADALKVVRKHGRRLTDHSPAEDIHRVRKKAKVLRYLLEAFAAVLPAEHLAPATKELKKFQDVLGLFQDRDVQVHTIRGYTELAQRQKVLDPDLMLAMGALRAHVREDAERERVRCLAAFAAFDAKENHRRYAALVALPETTHGRDVGAPAPRAASDPEPAAPEPAAPEPDAPEPEGRA
jgi:CHAD domain-containing protein